MRRVKQGLLFLVFQRYETGKSLGTGVSAGLPTAKNTGWREGRKRNFANGNFCTVTGLDPVCLRLSKVAEGGSAVFCRPDFRVYKKRPASVQKK